MTIHVTQEDIANGIPGYADLCPIAKAASRALGYPVWAWSTAIRKSGSPLTLAKLPKEAEQFVRNFDDGKTASLCKPFSFDIDLPGEPLPLPIPEEEPMPIPVEEALEELCLVG